MADKNKDKYDDEDVEDVAEVATGPTDAELTSQVAERETKVNALLSKGNAAEALPLVLASPPQNAKEQSIKDRNAKLVFATLGGFKDADIEKAIGGLTAEQIDVLMMYIYRGLGNADECAKVLKWHEKTTDKGGLGSIVRALTAAQSV